MDTVDYYALATKITNMSHIHYMKAAIYPSELFIKAYNCMFTGNMLHW